MVIPYSETNNVPYHIPIINRGMPHLTTLNIDRRRGNNDNNIPSSKPDLTTPWQTNKPSGNPDITVVETIYITVGWNQPHDTVATNKPSGKSNITTPWQLINLRVNPTSRPWKQYITVGWNQPYDTVATNKSSGNPDIMVVEIIYSC